jgi:preprotein translocase subunit SecE
VSLQFHGDSTLAVKLVAIIDNVKGAGGNVTGSWRNFRTFLTEVRNELKRVTWPSRKEVYATTIVVILTSIFFGLYLFALDGVFNIGIQWIFKQFGVA